MSEEVTKENDAATTMSEDLDRSVSLLETAPDQAKSILEDLQLRIAQIGIFSRNESLDDIATKSLPFLCLEHYLAVALTSIPGTSNPSSPKMSVPEWSLTSRLRNLHRACDLWDSFLQSLQQLEFLEARDQRDLETLTELSASTGGEKEALLMTMPFDRDTKIARFKAKQEAQGEKARLLALKKRRTRLGVAETEDLVGYDEESLERTVALHTIRICISEAIDEWANTLRELPMLRRMLASQEDQAAQDRHRGIDPRASQDPREQQHRPPPSSYPLKVTHITKDNSGQLQIRKEDIKSQVFRPGWNQPTMSLEELAEMEVEQAMERDVKQTEAQILNARAPRRFDQLVKDGLEDDMELVEASAALDRNWDNWKDENPRGSGNKRGDVGDRNF